MHKRIDFHGRLDGRTPLGDGSVRFTARLTRTGVFDYGDHKELRLPEEVFRSETLDSFKGLAITEGHQGWLDSGNWRDFAVGHVGDDVRQDGEYVVASLVVKDRSTLAKIDAKDLVEISMGYSVNLDKTPGETEDGTKYDSIQRDIVGNHAALGPENWGRAGTSVRLLDGAAYSSDMTVEKRIDAPVSTAEIEANLIVARKDLEAANARADKAEAERDAAIKALENARNDAANTKAGEDARVDARVALVDSARSVLGKEFEYAGKSDKDLRLAVLAKVDGSIDYAAKTDSYIEAAFDIAIRTAKADQSELATVAVVVADASAAPAPKSALDQAWERAEQEAKELAKGGAPVGAMLRK